MQRIIPWIAAARLRTLPLSVSGIIVGAALGDSYFWKSTIFWLAILTTLSFQILSNFANDYGDGVKGTDAHRKGEKRQVASGAISVSQMKQGIKITSLIALALAITLIYKALGTEKFYIGLIFLLLGIVAIIAAIKYTVGKNAYGYSGLGDLFVFIFFGLVSVAGSYFLFTKQLPWDVFLPAIAMGCLSVGVLNLNNMRDIENDKKHNKNTLVVKIGSKQAKWYQAGLFIVALLCLGIYSYIHFKSFVQLSYLLAFIPLVSNLVTVFKNKNPSLLDGELKKVALSTFLLALIFAFTH
jgi:1,4-dihydroxy-2-naphthoate octaprenyltransferase